MARGARGAGRCTAGCSVDKPAGPTSAAVVATAKWALDAAKAGHAGTLDPAATGLLAVAFGEATKTVPYVTDAAEGLPLHPALGRGHRHRRRRGRGARRPATRAPTRPRSARRCPAFTGDILQVPPQVSAVKVAGRRAYALARAGEALELAARPLHVARLELVELARPRHRGLRDGLRQGRLRAQPRPRPRAGARLPRACRGAAAALVGAVRRARTRSTGRRSRPGGTPALAARLLPVAAGLAGLPELPVDAEAAARLANGNPAPVAAARARTGRPRLGEPRRPAAGDRHRPRRPPAPGAGLRARLTAGQAALPGPIALPETGA